jgi:hypothetical protein
MVWKVLSLCCASTEMIACPEKIARLRNKRGEETRKIDAQEMRYVVNRNFRKNIAPLQKVRRLSAPLLKPCRNRKTVV